MTIEAVETPRKHKRMTPIPPGVQTKVVNLKRHTVGVHPHTCVSCGGPYECKCTCDPSRLDDSLCGKCYTTMSFAPPPEDGRRS